MTRLLLLIAVLSCAAWTHGTGSGGGQLITNVTLSPNTFVASASTGIAVGTASVSVSSGSTTGTTWAFSSTGTCAGQGADNATFAINGSTGAVTTAAATSAQTYHVCIVASLGSASNSPYGSPQTIIGTSAIAGTFTCDVFAANGATCVSAYSFTRKMLAAYAGPLYQLTSASGGVSVNIGALSDGSVDIASSDAFLAAHADARYTIAYDQVGSNNLVEMGTLSGPPYMKAAYNGLPIFRSDLNVASTGNGIGPCAGAWNANCTGLGKATGNVGTATGRQPLTVYEVRTSESGGDGAGDFGNAEQPPGVTPAANFEIGWGYASVPGDGVMSQCSVTSNTFIDMEYYQVCPSPPVMNPHVMSIWGKSDGTQAYQYQADALSATAPTLLYQGTPVTTDTGYGTWVPALQGRISIGFGGDGSAAWSPWFEGAVLSGVSSTTADAAVQANISAFYGPKDRHTFSCGTAYCGPGDIITSGVTAAYGLRAYSLATRGNKLVNVCLHATPTTCADFSSDPTTGAIVIGTVGGQSCSSVACDVATAYELSGSGAPNLIGPSGSRLAFVVDCTPNHKPCIQETTGNSYGVQKVSASTNVPTLTMPYTLSMVAERVGFTQNWSTLMVIGLVASAHENSLGFSHYSGFSMIYNNTPLATYQAAALDTMWNYFAITANTPNCTSHNNGGSVPFVCTGITNPDNTEMTLGVAKSGGDPFWGCTCNFTEAQYIQGSITDAQGLSASANAKAYYGY